MSYYKATEVVEDIKRFFEDQGMKCDINFSHSYNTDSVKVDLNVVSELNVEKALDRCWEADGDKYK